MRLHYPLLAAGLLLVLSMVASPLAAQPAHTSAAPALSPLSPGLWWLPGRFPRERQPDGNSVVIEAPRGLIVIDTGRHAEHAQALLAFAAQRGQAIASVINTHWHLDHLGGNARLREVWPQLDVIGSPAVARAISERFPGFRRDLEAMLADPKTGGDLREMVRIDIALYDRAAAMRPTRLADLDDSEVDVAGRKLRIGKVAAASDGDLWIFDAASSVLMLGDLVTLPVPFFDTACPASWSAALARVDALPFERAVPGHGPVLDRAAWQRWRAAFGRLLDCAASDREARACSSGWIDDLGPLLEPQLQPAAHGMIAGYFAQNLRASDRDRFCAAR